jgi:general secretion pathway protein L
MFVTWWLQQMSELVPGGLMRVSARRSDAVLLHVGADGVSLLRRAAGITAELARSTADEAGFGELRRALDAVESLPHPVLLQLEPGAILQKRVSFPIGARRDLESLLGLEMDRETPFSRDEVYWDYAIRRQDAAAGRIEVDLLVVPRAYLDPIIAATRSAGFDPTGIEIETGDNKSTVIQVGETKRWRWLTSDRRLIALAATFCVLLILAITTPFIAQQFALAAAQSTIDSLTNGAQEAASLRQSVDQNAGAIDFLSRERLRNGSVLTALAAATRLLPDDSHLTAFGMRDGRVTITGESPSAANLVDLLSKSKDFRAPAFDSPVVRNESGKLETFTISASLAGAGGS